MYKNVISRQTVFFHILDVDHWFDIVDNANECKRKYSCLGFRFLQHKSEYIIINDHNCC